MVNTVHSTEEKLAEDGPLHVNIICALGWCSAEVSELPERLNIYLNMEPVFSFCTRSHK